MSDMSASNTKKATFGAGCFWGVEAAFRQIDGVTQTAVGYMGGNKLDPTYHEVCTDRTGHAEVVQVEYDPEKVSYEQIVDTFWNIHDPTQLNRQGPDFGSQYRTAIFYHDDEQQRVATTARDALQAANRYAGRPVVTQIEPVGDFWVGEDYHQQYLEKRGPRLLPRLPQIAPAARRPSHPVGASRDSPSPPAETER